MVKHSVVTIRRCRVITFEDDTVEFLKTCKERFSGYNKIGNAYVATVEKTIVDSLYFGSPPISYVEEALSESLRRKIINLDQFEDFTVRMKTKAVAKSVETLLRTGNIDSARLQAVM